MYFGGSLSFRFTQFAVIAFHSVLNIFLEGLFSPGQFILAVIYTADTLDVHRVASLHFMRFLSVGLTYIHLYAREVSSTYNIKIF